MRKNILVILTAALLIPSVALRADDKESKIKLKPYGFFRSYAFYDTRATKSLTEDLFFFVPLDKNVSSVSGNDMNAVGTWGYQVLTSRVGLDVSGFHYQGMRVTGKMEADFYCLNSGGNTGTLRMRQAYINLFWDERGAEGKTDFSLKIGQTWHPMAADMAHVIDLETATPFSPFNRSAQLMFDATYDKQITLTAGLLSHMQFRSNGPAGSTNKYQRHAIPEIYVGLSYKTGGALMRVGASINSIRPHYGYEASTGKKYNEWLTTVTPFAYAQYTHGLFQIKAKTTYAQAAEYMQMNSGYAVTGLKSDGISNEYSPIRSSVSCLSASYGKKWQVMGMVGYMKSFGCAKEVTGDIYFSGNGYANINQMVKVAPTVLYNMGKLQFAFEYELCTVQYGDLNTKALATDNLHWVTNNRFLFMTKFSF